VFNINYDRLIQLLLPVHLRGQRMILFLKAMIRPLLTLYYDFIAYRTTTLRTISHTGQVMYLEQLLNDLYSPNARGIEIIDSTDSHWAPVIFNYAEGQIPVYLYNNNESETPVTLYNQTEYNYINDFIVRVPNGIVASGEDMRAIIDHYRQAGKRYILQYYDLNPTI